VFHFWGVFWIGWWGYFYTDDADYADLHGFVLGVCGVFYHDGRESFFLLVNRLRFGKGFVFGCFFKLLGIKKSPFGGDFCLE
jgi:hypothetical protein